MSRIVGAWENKGLTGPRNLWRPNASCLCQSACVTWNMSPQNYSLPCVTQETWNTWLRQHLMVPGTWEKLGTQFNAHGHLETTLNISFVLRFPTKAGQQTGDRWGQSPEGSSCGKGRHGDRSQTCACRAEARSSQCGRYPKRVSWVTSGMLVIWQLVAHSCLWRSRSYVTVRDLVSFSL